ncbi:MAG: ABC transporter permease subunit [Proteobacteria bacterium]|nr:ABC transporter permease subunit [Pseudomonadota bacterium]
MFHIATHELRRLFKSPLAWILFAVVQFLLAIFFLLILSQYMDPAAASLFANYGVTEIVVVGLLQIAGIILLLITPFVTMHTFSEERQSGCIQLLLSSPISMTELVLGKYLGVICYLFLLLSLIALMPLSLLMGTELDLLQLLSGIIGLILLASSFAAIGLFMSSLTSLPAVAAISTFGILFVLWIMNMAGSTGSELFREILTYASLLKHYHNLLDGIFNSADVIYYLLVSTLFIVLSIWRLDSERLL